MQIISWNVASIRARLPLLTTLLSEKKPDILFLQEIKALPATFPFNDIEASGYHAYISGQKGFNGVAILSRFPLQNIQTSLPQNEADEQARFIQAEDDKTIYISVYVPNGNAPLNNPTDTTRLHYKQAWLDSFLQHLNTLSLTGKQIIIGGDFNVIARDEDVYNINAFQGNALVDPTVRRQFTDITNLPFINTLRFLHPTEIIYSFWDFQMGAAQRNLGILLDYIFISSRMQARLTSAGVYKDYRYKPKPSDHAPVFCELQEA